MRKHLDDVTYSGVLAGAAGGIAEIVWIALYAQVSGTSAAEVARGVTAAVAIDAGPATAVWLGLAVHMILAVGLGVALAFAAQAAGRLGGPARYALVVAALPCVWAMNFFVILPWLSPAFVQMVPYAISFTSKLMFGIAAAEVLRHRVRDTARAPHLRIVHQA